MAPGHDWPDMSDDVRRHIRASLRRNLEKPRDNPGVSALLALQSEGMTGFKVNCDIFAHREGVARSESEKRRHLGMLDRVHTAD